MFKDAYVNYITMADGKMKPARFSTAVSTRLGVAEELAAAAGTGTGTGTGIVADAVMAIA